MQEDSYMYRTVRLEWYINCYTTTRQKPNLHLKKTYGPFPNRPSATGHLELLIGRAPNSDKFDITSIEKEVDVEPIFVDMINLISTKINQWVDSHMIHKKNRRKNIYFSEHIVRRSLETLALSVLKESIATNKENPHASTETEKRR